MSRVPRAMTDIGHAHHPKEIRAWLNGEIIDGVFAYDLDAGWVETKYDDNGNHPGHYTRRYGNVQIVSMDDSPETVKEPYRNPLHPEIWFMLKVTFIWAIFSAILMPSTPLGLVIFSARHWVEVAVVLAGFNWLFLGKRS